MQTGISHIAKGLFNGRRSAFFQGKQLSRALSTKQPSSPGSTVTSDGTVHADPYKITTHEGGRISIQSFFPVFVAELYADFGDFI